MAATLKDIARECGLAVSTVSNILNNHHSSFASEEVRARVHAAAERLGYKKNYLSSSLRTRKTRSVGLILDQIDQVSRQEFLVAFVEPFGQRGFEVALAEHRHDPDRAVAALEGFAERFKDGVVLFTDLLGRSEDDQERLRRVVAASPLKIVGIGSRLRGTLPSLDVDRGWAVDRTVEHFLAQGRRRILVAYEYDYDMRPSFRFGGHPAVTLLAGIHEPRDFFEQMAGDRWKEFDALFFRTDRVGIPALNWLQARGARVPQDREVISFDNFPFSEFTVPGLSTWDIGFSRLGRRAQEILAQWMGGGESSPDEFEGFRPAFVARQSHQGEL